MNKATALAALAGAILSASPPIQPPPGADGYVFRTKDFSHLAIAITVTEYPDRNALRAEHWHEYPAQGYPVGLLGFSTWDDTGCHIHVLDPTVTYEPDVVGHELFHCLHGQFHKGQDASLSRKAP